MNREIKFRAWDEETETMYYSDKCWENADATFVCENDGTLKCYVPEDVAATQDEPAHTVGRELKKIMEYTNYKDKGGVPIYEKAIMNFKVDKSSPSGGHYAGTCGFHPENARVVELVGDCWMVGGFRLSTQLRMYEVIGDTYKDPELLEPE